MLPTIDLNKLGEHLKTISFDEFNLYGVVKEWIDKNVLNNPPDHYIKAAINGLIDEKII